MRDVTCALVLAPNVPGATGWGQHKSGGQKRRKEVVATDPEVRQGSHEIQEHRGDNAGAPRKGCDPQQQPSWRLSPKGLTLRCPLVPARSLLFPSQTTWPVFTRISLSCPSRPTLGVSGRCSGLLCLVNTPGPRSSPGHPVSPGGF